MKTKQSKPAHASALVNAVVEFDAKHTESPLCACKMCNDEWLAKRDQPIAQKHTKHRAPPIDIANKGPFAKLAKQHGVQIELRNEHNMRIAFWRLVDPTTGYIYDAGFDADAIAVFTRMEQENQTLRGAGSALHMLRESGPLRSSASGGNLTGGPFCVVCDVAGGLPCPAMVGDALRLGLKLAYPPGDARLGPCHVHPGRCRKRLRALLDGARAAATGKVSNGT